MSHCNLRLIPARGIIAVGCDVRQNFKARLALSIETQSITAYANCSTCEPSQTHSAHRGDLSAQRNEQSPHSSRKNA